MDHWKRSFLDRLGKAQAHWLTRFEELVEARILPTLEDYKEFLADNGFRLSSPQHEPDRRSFKFELAENAYLLLILRSTGIGEFELRSECFVPGREPVLSKATVRIADVDDGWAAQQLRRGLDAFVDLLAEQPQEVLEPLVV
jgi:hypothetical protein